MTKEINPMGLQVSAQSFQHNRSADIILAMTFKPLHFFAVAIAGWMNRQQQDTLAYLKEENRILREKLGHKRIRLNDAQRRRLAMAAARVGATFLRQLGTLFSPDTLLKWNRMLVARRYDSSDRRGELVQHRQILHRPQQARAEY